MDVLTVGSAVLAVATELLAAVSGTLQTGTVAARHTGFTVDWGRIHDSNVELWLELERRALSHQEAADRLRAIPDRHVAIDRQSIAYRVDAKVLAHCFDEAEAYAFVS